MKQIVFKDRRDAGRQLAIALSKRRFQHPILVIGIPRGGVAVAYEVAEALSAPLDVIITKIAHHINLNWAWSRGRWGSHHRSHKNCAYRRGSPEYLKDEIAFQAEEINRRLKIYRGERPLPEISGKTVIVIDDGIATGYTFRTALEGLRRKNPSRLIGAAPVAAQDSYEMLQPFADELIA
jgi:predicted phosphoribosyltransferase